MFCRKLSQSVRLPERIWLFMALKDWGIYIYIYIIYIYTYYIYIYFIYTHTIYIYTYYIYIYQFPIGSNLHFPYVKLNEGLNQWEWGDGTVQWPVWIWGFSQRMIKAIVSQQIWGCLPPRWRSVYIHIYIYVYTYDQQYDLGVSNKIGDWSPNL